MEQGLLDAGEINGELLVFIDRGANGKPSHPYLMRIVPDSTQKVVSKIIKVYPEQNAASPNFLSKILQDIEKITDVPYESKGLIMWSHGNAWLPSGVSLYSDRDKILDSTKITHKEKSFGLDEETNNSETFAEMDIIDMSRALSSYQFDFIIFDACFMSSIEVLYELKDVCNYIIASPTEILSAGLPYKQIVPDLFTYDFNAVTIARNTFDFYNKQKGALKTSSICVVKTKELFHIATFFKTLTLKLNEKVDIEYNDSKYFKDSLQQFDRLKADFLFDLYDFVNRVCDENKFLDMKNKFDDVWNKAIIYSRHTPFVLGTLSLQNCNGVSLYIPQSYKSRKEINLYYKKLKWYEESNYGFFANGF